MVQCQNSTDPHSEIPYESLKLQSFSGSVAGDRGGEGGGRDSIYWCMRRVAIINENYLSHLFIFYGNGIEHYKVKRHLKYHCDMLSILVQTVQLLKVELTSATGLSS